MVRLTIRYFLSIFFLVLIVILNKGWSLSQTPPVSLVGQREKNIHLFNLKPEKVIYNEIGYTIHYKYRDKFPSKRVFLQLQHQLKKCGWKQYDALEFVVNDVDWTSYLEDRAGKETAMIHRFSRTYIDQAEKRLAVILIRYSSKASSMKETMRLDKPNNNMQFITLQFMPFNEEEYREKLDEYKMKEKEKREEKSKRDVPIK